MPIDECNNPPAMLLGFRVFEAPRRRVERAVPARRRCAARCASAIVFCTALAGCTTVPHGQGRDDDPLAPLNRSVFAINDALGDALVTPLAKVDVAPAPPFVWDRIKCGDGQPRRAAHLRQRRPAGPLRCRGTTFARFFANTIAGVGGMFDFASAHGLPKQTGDFGQTLYTWGIDDGPYLVLPLFGPSNVRDAFGLTVDLVTTPPALLVHGILRRHRQHRVRCGERHRDRGPEHRLDRGDQGELARLLRVREEHCEAAPCVGASRGPGPRHARRPNSSIRARRRRIRSRSAAEAATVGAQEVMVSRGRPSVGRTSRSRRSACWRSESTSAGAPPVSRIAANSDRRVASSLIVPLR